LSFTILKNALSSRPTTPYGEPGPLYGAVLPILISVAVTPGVSASAAVQGPVAHAAAVPRAVLLLMTTASLLVIVPNKERITAFIWRAAAIIVTSRERLGQLLEAA
jgi:hypothetical protein